MDSKTIAILTSGGDSPGMNAAIWAAVKSAYSRGMTILGINRGYQGLIEGDMAKLTPESVFMARNLGGTMLRTARCLAMLKDTGRDEAYAMAKQKHLDGLIVVGGDGSYHGAQELTKRGLPTIGLPGTIDNDLPYTDYTLGFDTACNTAMQSALKVRDTMESHGRVGIVEVMGRYCGDIALNVAIGAGADYVLVPEIEYKQPFDICNLADRLCMLHTKGRKSFLIILAEGICFSDSNRATKLRETLQKELDRRQAEVGDIRETVMGYSMRGGMPTAVDVNLAVRMADRAVELLSRGIGNKAVGIRRNEIIDMDIMKALEMKKEFNRELYDLVQTLAEA